MNHRFVLISLTFLLMLSGCNLPLLHQPTSPQPTLTPPGPAAATALATLSGPGVQIVSPANGAEFSAGSPIQVQFTARGGPFIEADLSDEAGPVDTLPLDSSNPTPTGTLTWKSPSGGSHTLTVILLSPDKTLYTAKINVTVTGSAAVTQAPTSAAPTAAATADPARAAAMTQVLQILHDTYGLKVSAPPLARKYRPGVPNDPWDSVVYLQHWMYAISVFPDRVEQDVHPINMQSDGSVPIPSGSKATPVCRPAGTLKILVALVDYQNLSLTKEQEVAALQKATQSINTKMSRYSSAGGASSPILQIQTTPVFLSPAPSMPEHLLTPAIVKSVSGVDPAAYDLLVQIDLDAADTRRHDNAALGEDTNGMEFDACQGKDLSIWIGLDTLDQALDQDRDNTMESILSHELLHTFGYPFDHSWPAGDGTQIDSADQSDIFNWPTLILGWTDTDGDGIPEIIDPTPYGS